LASELTYPEQLLRHALHLTLQSDEELVEAHLRRTVSAAYYAVFHSLTLSAAENWKHERQRHRFARLFDHKRMKDASFRVMNSTVPSDQIEAEVVTKLKLVANAFIKLQQARHIADYDNSKVWSPTEVNDDIFEP
jgi:hypothetical protein